MPSSLAKIAVCGLLGMPRLRKGCLVELFDVKTSLTADDGAVVNAEAANNTVGQLLELGSSGSHLGGRFSEKDKWGNRNSQN